MESRIYTLAVCSAEPLLDEFLSQCLSEFLIMAIHGVFFVVGVVVVGDDFSGVCVGFGTGKSVGGSEALLFVAMVSVGDVFLGKSLGG